MKELISKKEYLENMIKGATEYLASNEKIDNRKEIVELIAKWYQQLEVVKQAIEIIKYDKRY